VGEAREKAGVRGSRRGAGEDSGAWLEDTAKVRAVNKPRVELL